VVHDTSGTPVEGAVVLFTAPSPPHRDIAAMTGSSGAFAMANLVPGSYTVAVNAPSYQGGQEVVEVEGGREASIVITLQRNDSAGPG
jgi:hypothetical protein